VFRRLLIANRGEIALRITRACRKLGIEAFGVYSEADRDAPWLAGMDHSICIGPARAEGSYLNADAILQAAEQTESQAIHPGYGFLSENATFAARCEQQGLTFVGPTADAIRRMGDKTEAKRTMADLGLPTVPGSDGVVTTPADAVRLAGSVGYPVLLKAAAGGGGRGMRRCDDAAELEAAFGEAGFEAETAFGNPALYLERYIEAGRHIEFQVLVDAFGKAVDLGERECSIQRKHQKLVEESPSPVLDATARSRWGERVARAVAAAGYRNAGTVEFLRDSDGELYFMEMNTRLQVEHPVTEMISGVDLVEQQLRIAANERLALDRAAVELSGHAIEFRINAEDPENDFRPDPGRIDGLELPRAASAGVTVRWDSAIVVGYQVPPHYDSMIGKLVIHAATRDDALRGADAALADLRIDGVQTTLALHRRILSSPEFREGRYDIHTLPRMIREAA
jgi:acetyl-CoA carboxylase biotin carboxylase subunit